ncbi:MAG: hypothetical protein JRG91_19420 [Deltaproteobacteria bacterium]|nr:hypothetical protein [Deltaproteobacteria bacterium]
MKNLMLVLIAVVAVSMWGCKNKAKEALEEAEKALETAEGEGEAEEEGETEEAEEGGDEGGGGGACEAYAKCCEAYVDALAKVDGIPEASLKATKDGCAQIENLKSLPTAADSCKQAMDAMKQGMDAMKAMPGFEAPSACE